MWRVHIGVVVGLVLLSIDIEDSWVVEIVVVGKHGFLQMSYLSQFPLGSLNKIDLFCG